MQEFLQGVIDWIAGLGPWGPLIFIALYVVACVCLIPGSVLTLSAGAIFGLAWGTVYVLIGAMLGASAAFLVGRHFARDWVARKIAPYPTFTALDEAVAEEGWKIVLLTRLSPVFPFFLMNYAYGITKVSFRSYFMATAFGIIPGTVMFIYLGSLARAGVKQTSPAEWILRLLGLLATVLVAMLVARVARKALRKRLGQKPDEV